MGKKRVYYFLLSVLFANTLLANTAMAPNSDNAAEHNNVGIFSADNSSQGIKNTQPVDISVSDDSLLGLIGDAKILLGFNDANAAALEFAGGPRVFRGNATYGFAFNDKNRIKITGEYLTEDLDFDFYSGDTRQWVKQGAVGAAYQYWLGGNVFKSLQVGSHYSHAGNKDLSDKLIDLGDGVTILDERRIAGGDDWNGTAETAMRLWPHSLFTLGADYDQVRYDTKYNNDNDGDAQGFGGHARLQQLLAPNTQLELQSGLSQLANSYGANLNWLWTTMGNTAVGVGLNSIYTNDRTTERRWWVNGISLNVAWDTPREHNHNHVVARYSDPDVSAENMLTWTATPAVRMPDVLAIADERVTRSFTSVTATCPSASSLVYNGTTQQYSAPGGWVQSYPAGTLSSGLTFSLNSANIMSANSGEVQCLYLYPGPNQLILSNAHYGNVQPVGSNWGSTISLFWPTSPDPVIACNSSIPGDCPFATVDSHLA